MDWVYSQWQIGDKIYLSKIYKINDNKKIQQSKIISYKMWWWWGLGLLTVAPPIFTGDDSFFKLHIVFNFSELKFRANLFRIKIYGYFIWV